MASNQDQNDHARFIQAGNLMRQNVQEEYDSATRATLGWTMALIVVSVAFAMLTAAAIRRFTQDDVASYMIGGIVHMGTGLALHAYLLERHYRAPGILRFFTLLIFLACVGAIAAISYFRADLMIEQGRPRVTAYMLTTFMGLLEIGLPSLFGFMLFKAWVRKDIAYEDLQWVKGVAMRIPQEDSPDYGWLDEGYQFRKRCNEIDFELPKFNLALQTADAHGHGVNAADAEAKIYELRSEKEKLQRKYDRLITWYPGQSDEAEREIEKRLKGEEPPTPISSDGT